MGLSWVLSACGGDARNSAGGDEGPTSSNTQGSALGGTGTAPASSTSSGGESAVGGGPSAGGATSTTVSSTTGQAAGGEVGGWDSGSDLSSGGASATTGGAGGGSAGVGGVDGEEPDLSDLDLEFASCAVEGQIHCYGTNQRVQLICHDYKPEVYGVCLAGERCDTRADNLGQCEPVLPECVGREPYDGFCVGDTFVECGVDLLDHAYEEVCTDSCVPREDGADCIHTGCGDGTLGAGEACDDGNNTSGDGCAATCAWDPPLGVPVEDGVVFGQTVAMSGDTIAVSGYRPEPGGSEIFVFRRDGIAWRLEALLGTAGDDRATNQAADTTYLGDRLALDGDTLAATGYGVNSYEDDTIVIYQRTGTTWELQGQVIPEVPGSPGVRDETTAFGAGLSLNGDTLVVGAQYDQEAASFAGAAYVYRREQSMWRQEQKLFAALPGGASDAEESAVFGSSVAVSGDRIVVGALAKEGATFQTGAAYVFYREGSSWSPEHRFMPPQPSVITYDTGGPQCGSAVAISGDTIVVGCSSDDEEVLPNSGQEPGSYAGSAYVLERGSGGWEQSAKLRPLPGTHTNDDKSIAEFGELVAISGDASLIAVVSPRDYTYGFGGGSTHVFRRSGSSWTTEQKLVPIPPRHVPIETGFGTSLAVSGENVLVGAGASSLGGRALLYEFVDPTWELRLKLLAVEP